MTLYGNTLGVLEDKKPV